MTSMDETGRAALAATGYTNSTSKSNESKLSLSTNGTSSNKRPLEQHKPKLDEQLNRGPEPVEPFPFAGYLATLIASLLFANAGLCIKLLPVETSIQEKVKACMIRAMFMILYSAIGISYRGLSFRLPRDELLINFLRTLFGSLGMIFNYISLNYISVGETNAITYSSPIWTCLLGFFILGEPLKLTMLVALPASLLGIVLLAKPDLLLDTRTALTSGLQPAGADLIHGHTMGSNSTNSTGGTRQETKWIELAELEYYESRLPGILAALACSVLMAFIIIVLKYRKKTPIETCSFYLGLGAVLLCLGVQSIIGFGSMPSSLLECFIHFYVGLISYMIQFLFQWALQFVPAGIYSVARSLDIAFGFLMGATFLQDSVPWTSLAGSILTILVVVILVLDEHLVRATKRLLSRGTPSFA